MLSLKACPRCRGDLMLEQYLGDSELVCIQCGKRLPFKPATGAVPAVRVAGKAA
jgi:uncharacterized protein YbaR (Trm112 family)